MGAKTKIQWTQSSWNPIRGCSRISEGCRNCYAETIAARFHKPGLPYEGLINSAGHWNGQIRFVEEKLLEPLSWKKGRHIFVNSMSDLFHENIPTYQVELIHDVMGKAGHHRFQILTKRPERMRAYYETHPGHRMRHLWIGVSIENQASVESRLLELAAIQGPMVRWVSVEPLLGPVELGLLGTLPATITGSDYVMMYQRIQWVVAGGESGTNARPMDPLWVRTLRDECGLAGVPFFFKQWGTWAPAASIDPERDPHVVGGALRGRGVERQLFIRPGDVESEVLFKVGKDAGGRILDGRVWDARPPWGMDG